MRRLLEVAADVQHEVHESAGDVPNPDRAAAVGGYCYDGVAGPRLTGGEVDGADGGRGRSVARVERQVASGPGRVREPTRSNGIEVGRSAGGKPEVRDAGAPVGGPAALHVRVRVVEVQ